MPSSRSGLWWLAVLILAAGGLLAYSLMIDRVAPNAWGWGLLVMSVSIALAGICVISATAHWWLKR